MNSCISIAFILVIVFLCFAADIFGQFKRAIFFLTYLLLPFLENFTFKWNLPQPEGCGQGSMNRSGSYL